MFDSLLFLYLYPLITCNSKPITKAHMARATNKTELQLAAKENFDKLFAIIDSLSLNEQEAIFPFEDRDRNIRDILIHLYEWHKLLLNWINQNLAGVPTPFLPEPYNWKTYPAMNVSLWEKHQLTPYAEALELVKNSHNQVMLLVSEFSDSQLFTKKHYPWTGTTNLGSYCVSSTSSHYDWAIKKIKKYKKTL